MRATFVIFTGRKTGWGWGGEKVKKGSLDSLFALKLLYLRGQGPAIRSSLLYQIRPIAADNLQQICRYGHLSVDVDVLDLSDVDVDHLPRFNEGI